MNKVVIVSATRTAIGKFGGSLKDIVPGQLGSVVIKDVLKRVDVDPAEVDEVIMGNVLSGGQGMNVARQSSIWGGVPIKVPAFSVNKVCGSSMKSVILGAQSIMLGDEEIVPVPVPQPKGEPLLFDTDEVPRFGTTKETLAKLKPAFKKNGTVTAG
ncbi:MAG: thiolase family protein, partial [Syntrophales bacterium]